MMKSIIKKLFTSFLFLSAFIMLSCNILFNLENEEAVLIKPGIEINGTETTVTERQWTILVYMAADNNLEGAALRDLHEMERSQLNTDEVTVLVLMDRATSGDMGNGNWSDTRLFRVETGKVSAVKDFISKETDCPPLNIVPGVAVEADMSSPYTLSRVLDFVFSEYPALNYGMIMWGHGTGWRSEEVTKAFALDDYSGKQMSLCQMREGLEGGLNGRKLDFLGFDTCFGGELEVFYELKDVAACLLGSAGLVLSEGWNYTDFFNRFQNEPLKIPENLSRSIVESFSYTYRAVKGASICAMKSEDVDHMFSLFDTYCLSLSDKMDSEDKRTAFFNYVSSSSFPKYTSGGSGSDVYLDLNALVRGTEGLFSVEEENCVSSYLKDLVLSSWSSELDFAGPGVFFNTLSSDRHFSITHPQFYIKSAGGNRIRFVNDSVGYVPCGGNSKSLLDRLFYYSGS